MRLVPVESSAVAAVRYDVHKQEMDLLYKHRPPKNGLYRYFGVPPEEALGLLNAESVGKYVNQVIKRHEYRPLDPRRDLR